MLLIVIGLVGIQEVQFQTWGRLIGWIPASFEVKAQESSQKNSGNLNSAY